MTWRRRRMAGRGGVGVRRNRPLRPGCEVLEGRTLLVAPALDPTFGRAGVALGPANSFDPGNAVTTVAVQPDGKVVAATIEVGYFPGEAPLVVRRFHADGTPDLTYGSGGAARIPFGDDSPYLFSYRVVEAPRNLAFGPDGSLYLATEVVVHNEVRDCVVRLDADGDPGFGFGIGGVLRLPAGITACNDVAVQADGKVLVAGRGTATVPGTSLGYEQAVVLRLTAAGALDPTFAGDGSLEITLPDSIPQSRPQPRHLSPVQLSLAPDGRAYLATNIDDTNPFGPDHGVLTRINTDGSVDASYGVAGHAPLRANALDGLAVQPDGRVVVAGQVRYYDVGFQLVTMPTLGRLNVDGSADPTFAGINAAGGPINLSRFADLDALGGNADGSTVVSGVLRGGPRAVVRFTAGGVLDTAFGVKVIRVPVLAEQSYRAMTLTPSGQAVLGGGALAPAGGPNGTARSQGFVARVTATVSGTTPGDFDGDGRTDLAAQVGELGAFAVRRSTGGDTLDPFGVPGIGQTIATPGDFDGDGYPDVAAYLAPFGVLAYRPSSGATGVMASFGSAGPGASIPAVGDYDGDGRSDVAVYLPASGAFAVAPSGGGPNYFFPFGSSGVGQSVPAVGDYDGDGRADFAVYLPAFGSLAVAPSGGASPYYVAFGPAGAGASIPVPGDYDGDGRTDVAVYLPAAGAFAIRPSSGAANYLAPFGMDGAGRSVPAPGDYDGDGKTDLAVHLPTLGIFAYRRSGVGGDVLQGFGPAGPGRTVPAWSIPYAQPATVAGMAFGAGGRPGPVEIPLTADILDAIAGVVARRKGPA